MTIRKKLTSKFAIIVITILVFFSIAIYYFSSDYQQKEFYLRLRNKAITTAKLLIDTKGVDRDLLKAIDKNTVNALYDNKVVIYNYLNKEIYNSVDNEPTAAPLELLNKIRLEGEVRFNENEKEVIGIQFTDKYDRFVVIASAYDKYGLIGLKNLRLILIIGLLISIFITVLAGLLFSGQALEPISNVVHQVDNITVNNLSLRVDEGNGTDEIAQLAIKFNKMLEHLEASFEMQRSFVSNASHELRTPLTVIGGQIEIALMKKRSQDEYEAILQSIWEDIKNLNKLSNGLLDLAQTSMDVSRIKLKNVRIDEILWQAKAELINRQKDYSVHIEYRDLPEDEKKLTVMGSEQLLKTAFINIMDNACKYSTNKQVIIKIGFEDQLMLLQFMDSGIGIDDGDIKHVFEPFYRANTARSIAGHGIGLSLTERIIILHKGRVRLSSKLNKGTTVFIYLPIED